MALVTLALPLWREEDLDGVCELKFEAFWWAACSTSGTVEGAMAETVVFSFPGPDGLRTLVIVLSRLDARRFPVGSELDRVPREPSDFLPRSCSPACFGSGGGGIAPVVSCFSAELAAAL